MKHFLPIISVMLFAGRSESNPLAGSSEATTSPTAEKIYEIFNLTLSWHEAQIYCRERNMDLASIRSPEDNEFFLKMLQVEGLERTVDSM